MKDMPKTNFFLPWQEAGTPRVPPVHRSETSTLLMKTTMFLGDLRNNKMYLSAYIMGYAMGYMNIYIYTHMYSTIDMI